MFTTDSNSSTGTIHANLSAAAGPSGTIRPGRLAIAGLIGALALGGCVAEPDDAAIDTQTAEVAGTCSLGRHNMGVHVGAVSFAEQSAALDKVDAGWVRMLHQFKRCNDRLPAHCPKVAAWNCDASSDNDDQNDLDSYVSEIQNYRSKGLKVMLNVNAWAIPACVDESAAHPPATPKDVNSQFSQNWLASYTTELSRLLDYLRVRGALPDAVQVGNEPNAIEDMNCSFFGRMLLEADGVLRTKAPGVLRVVGGVINPFPHNLGNSCLSAAAAQARADWQVGHPNQQVPADYMSYHAVGLHMYGVRGDDNYRVDRNGQTVRDRWDGAIGSINGARAKFGPSPKIWVTETGGPLNEGASSELSENYKAAWLSFTLPHLAAKGEVDNVFVYRLLSGGEHLGLFNNNGSVAMPALDEVNAAVCGGIDPSDSGNGDAECSANGWCKCPNDPSIWYEAGATDANGQAARCDGQTPAGGSSCANGWCPCPNDATTWYEQSPSSPNNSQAVKCDGASTGGGVDCQNGWCRCPDDPNTWYDQSATSGASSQAERCGGQTGGGPDCQNGWCRCPNDPDTWYDQSVASGPNSQAERCQ